MGDVITWFYDGDNEAEGKKISNLGDQGHFQEENPWAGWRALV